MKKRAAPRELLPPARQLDVKPADAAYRSHIFARLAHEPLAKILAYLPAVDRIDLFTALRGAFKQAPQFLVHYRRMASSLPSVFFEPLDSHLHRRFGSSIEHNDCCNMDISIYLRVFAPKQLKEIAYETQAALAPQHRGDDHRHIYHYRPPPSGAVCKRCITGLAASTANLQTVSLYMTRVEDWVNKFLFRPKKQSQLPLYPPTLTEMNMMIMPNSTWLQFPTTLTTLRQRTDFGIAHALYTHHGRSFLQHLPDTLTALEIPDQGIRAGEDGLRLLPASLQSLVCSPQVPFHDTKFADRSDLAHIPNVTILPPQPSWVRIVAGRCDGGPGACWQEPSPDENFFRGNQWVLRENYALMTVTELHEQSFVNIPPTTQVLGLRGVTTPMPSFLISYLRLLPASIRVILVMGVAMMTNVGERLYAQPQPHVLWVEFYRQHLLRDMRIVSSLRISAK